MPRDAELDRLHEEQERAFSEKQEAYGNWRNRMGEQKRLYEAKERAKRACDEARADMNREYEELHRFDHVWDEYTRIKEANNPRIETLKHRADYLASQMREAFQRASDAYNYGDRSLAPAYSAEGREYKAELENLNEEISALCREVKSARLAAESWGRRDSSAFRAAKSRFEARKREQRDAQEELGAYVAETRRMKAEFENAKKRHLRLQELFQERLAAFRGRRRSEDDRLMDQAQIPFFYRRDCKVRREADGAVNFYFGGVGASDGIGHGHVSMDGSGRVMYNRDVFERHGGQNFADFQERQAQYRDTHSSSWQIQDDSGDYVVKVKGDYLHRNPHLGKDPDTERTDFLLFPKDQPGHAHASVGEDTDGEVRVWHDVEERSRRQGRSDTNSRKC